jgi:SAM-dependent methyltransferase
MGEKEWFESWFNTSYYHKLYAHRDDHEARYFIKKLVQQLDIDGEASLLDLACGRGRHAVFLNELGYHVTGIDLSEKSIEFAKQFEKPGLQFEVGDMRANLGENRFDFVFNLFTSFGYFEDTSDNIQALKAIAKSLKPNGRLVLDFMNVNKVKLGLVKEEIKYVEGIEFHIERILRDGMVVKRIRFEDKGQTFEYEEKVQLLALQDFEEMMEASGLEIENTYGDFNLQTFDFINSDRLILFASAKS